jgi:FkbM family methyltransferase
MLIFDEFKDEKESLRWQKWYAKDVSNYPIWNFKALDPSFSMKTCVDIGANIGGFSFRASQYFDKVLAFEPSSLIFARGVEFCIKMSAFNVDYYNLAVSKNTGDVVNLTCGSHYRADLKADHINSHNASIVWNEGKEKERALTISLDKIYELAGVDFIDYLKVDCEGSEYDILIDQDLSRIGLLCMEMHRPAPGVQFDEVQNKLLEQLRLENFETCLYTEHNLFAVNKKFNIPCPICTQPSLVVLYPPAGNLKMMPLQDGWAIKKDA